MNKTHDEIRIERFAAQLASRDFILQIQPIINEKCSAINTCLQPQSLKIMGKRIVVSDMKYPPEIQNILDKCDELIGIIKEEYSTEASKQTFIIKARKILNREDHKYLVTYA